MSQNRIDTLRKMVDARPNDARARFGLALELERLGRWEETIAELRRYLELADDEGNAYGRLAGALRRLGRDEEARGALEAGVAAANRHGHPTMAMEFEEELEAL